MRDEDFARVVWTPQVKLLGLPLHSYSIAHELYLLREDSPLITASWQGALLTDLLKAVLCCSSTYAELSKVGVDVWQPLKLAAWSWRIRRLHLDRQQNFDAALLVFRRYYLAGSQAPLTEAPEGAGRLLGAPTLVGVMRFLMSTLRLSRSAAMDYPLGEALWHYAAAVEEAGGVHIANAAELEMEEFAQAEDAKATGG